MERFRLARWLFVGLFFALVACQPVTRQPEMPTLIEHKIPTHAAHANGIKVGADGALWFAESGANQIGRIDMDGVVTEYPIPTEDALDDRQGFVALGPDGAMWFNEDLANKLGRIALDGTITEFALPEGTNGIREMVTGPDGALWVTAVSANKIMQLNTEGEVLAEYMLPNPDSVPVGMVVGPDNALWFVENAANQIGRITVDGEITEYTIPTAHSVPLRLTVGPDNALWFTLAGTNKIGRISLEGEITEFDLPDMQPVGIAAGADGALWFTGYRSTEIGRLTVDGVLTKMSIPTYAAVPYHIVAGPDGNLWFTEQQGNLIGQIILPVAATAEEKAVIAPSTTSAIFKLPMSISFSSDWSIEEEYPDVFTIIGPTELGFVLVEEATRIADAQPPFSPVPFPDDFVTWIGAEGLFQIVKTQPVVVGGFPGTQIDANGAAGCHDPQRSNGKRDWIIYSATGWNCRPGEHWRFVYLDDVNGEQLLIVNSGGPATDEEFNAGLEAAQKVLNSVAFPKPTAGASTPAISQEQTTFSPKLVKTPMSISFGADWQVDYDLPTKFAIRTQHDFGLSLYIVTNAKLADPIDGHLIPFPEDFMAWIKSNPDFAAVTSAPVTVAGIEGVQIDATPIWKSTTTYLKLFLSLSGDKLGNMHGQPDGENIVNDPEQWRFILLDDVHGERVLIILIDGNGHKFEDAVEQSQKVLDTVVLSNP